MIRLRSYYAPEHYSLIEHWLKFRGLDPAMAEDLAKTGFVAFKDNLAIAAGFLRMCEGSLAMIDGLVSNPYAPGVARHHALDEIIDELIFCARERGVKRILAYSVDNGTINRAQDHGFMSLPQVLLGLELGE